jgi:hypothetical protein
MTRYAAKLLFQFHIAAKGDQWKRRLCEERIINFRSRSPRDALKVAKLRGKRGEHSYTNADGNKVSFQFVGVLDLMSLGIECDVDEVWYEIRERLLPMERRARMVPGDRELLARLTIPPPADRSGS